MTKKTYWTIAVLISFAFSFGDSVLASLAFSHPAHDRPAFISNQSAVASPYALATLDATPADIYLSPHFMFAVVSNADFFFSKEKGFSMAIVHRKVTPTRVWPHVEGLMPFAVASATSTIHGGSNDTATMVIQV